MTATAYSGVSESVRVSRVLKIQSRHKDLFVEMFTQKFSVVIPNDMHAKTHFTLKSFSFLIYCISEGPDKK